MIFINQFHIALIHPLPLILPLNVILHTILTLRNRFYCLTIVMGLTYPQNLTYLSKLFDGNVMEFQGHSEYDIYLPGCVNSLHRFLHHSSSDILPAYSDLHDSD